MDVKNSSTTSAEPTGKVVIGLERPLQLLSSREILTIDEALVAIGAFGEVRLIKERDKLRFIQMVHSRDLRKEQ